MQRLRGLRVALATNAAVDGIPGCPHREATELSSRAIDLASPASRQQRAEFGLGIEDPWTSA